MVYNLHSIAYIEYAEDSIWLTFFDENDKEIVRQVPLDTFVLDGDYIIEYPDGDFAIA